MYIDQNLHKDVFVCGYFKNCTFISAASNLLWHSKKSNYVFPRTRNIHHIYWKKFYGSHTDTAVICFAHNTHMQFYFQAKFGDGAFWMSLKNKVHSLRNETTKYLNV